MIGADQTNQAADAPEPQPWRTAEDAKGWRVVGVGKRHPRWLEFKIAEIARQHDPVGVASDSGAADEYQPEARAIAELLRGLNPLTASSLDVVRLVHVTFVRFFDERLAGPPEQYAPLAAEIQAAWRTHAGTAAGVT